MSGIRINSLILLLTLVGTGAAQKNAAPPVNAASLGNTVNVHVCGNLYLAGQPTKDDIGQIKAKGIKRVITLREDGEISWDEAEAFKSAGVEFESIPLAAPESLTDEVFSNVREYLQDSVRAPTLLHCGSANRVGAVWMVHRVLDQGIEVDTAIKEAKRIGLRNPAYEKKAIDYITRHLSTAAAPKTSVRPGINDNFLNPDLDVSEWIDRFEIESREVFAARDDIVKATGIVSGATVADIGAGTGLFTRLFSDVVGSEGWVYAVDISPRFVEHINGQAAKDELQNVTTVLCRDDSVSLPPDSVDVAFICDTYHHFEYPTKTLRSIHAALRDEGRLIVIDFNRIPGVSREWTIGHVRAGKEVFQQEIEAAGFRLVGEKQIEKLKENYFLEFQKK